MSKTSHILLDGLLLHVDQVPIYNRFHEIVTEAGVKLSEREFNSLYAELVETVNGVTDEYMKEAVEKRYGRQ